MSWGPRRRWVLAAAAIVAVAGGGVAVAWAVGSDGDASPHHHHEGAAPDDGACSEQYNSASMHWNPAHADAMVDLGCPWPYPPGSVSEDGGAIDPALDAAPFEAIRYQAVWDAVQASGFGVCAVERLAEVDVTGFVSGFRYPLQTGGCLTNEPDASVDLQEYATRAQRDAAANAAAADGVLVLGRWAVVIDGPAAPAAADALVAAGAVPA